MTPEEARQEARNSAITGGEEKVAVFLKQQFRNLKTYVYPDLTVPEPDDGDGKEEAEYRRMTKELIDKRQFTDGNGKIVTLDDLDQKLDALPKDKDNPSIKEALGVDSLKEVVPTRGQLNAMGTAIGDGVAEQTGTVGFLGGATFGQAITGFLRWIAGLFTGESSFSMDSLKQSIAGVAAERMQQSVGGRLAQLRSEQPGMARMLTDDAITDITQTVGNTVRQQGGIAVDAPGETGLADTKAETIDRNKLAATLRSARHSIHEKVLHPEEGPSLEDKIAKDYGDGVRKYKEERWRINPARWFAPNEEEIRETSKKAAEVIAKSVSETITDPNFRTSDGRKLTDLENKEEYADAVAQAAADALKAKERDIDFAFKLDEKNGQGIAHLENFKAQIKEGVLSNYDQLVVASRAAGDLGDRALASARDAVDRNAGIGGAEEVSHVRAPTVGGPGGERGLNA